MHVMPATHVREHQRRPATLCAAAPVATKMPAPMIAPTPSAVELHRAEHAAQPVVAVHLLEQADSATSSQKLIQHDVGDYTARIIPSAEALEILRGRALPGSPMARRSPITATAAAPAAMTECARRA